MKVSKEIKVALLAIVAIVILFFGVRFLKGSELLSSVNTYYAIYDNIDGLAVANPVLINGYKVGQVERISLMQQRGNNVLVTFTVQEKINLGESARAVLATSDLLGSKAVVLDVGDVTNNPLADGDTLNATKEKGISELFQAKALPIAEKFDSTLARFNQIIGANDDQGLSNILGILVGDTTSVTSAVNNLEATTKTASFLLQSNERRLNATIANLELLTNSLGDQETGLPPLLTKVNQILDTVNNLQLEQTLNRLDQISQDLKSITAKIDQGEGSLGKLINDDSLYTNLNKSAEDLDRLLIDVRESPGRYVRFSVFGGRDKGGSNDEEEVAADND